MLNNVKSYKVLLTSLYLVIKQCDNGNYNNRLYINSKSGRTKKPRPRN